MRRLPVFQGYTVDERLREFRRIVYGELPEFIPFDSPRGQELLAELQTARRDNPGQYEIHEI